MAATVDPQIQVQEFQSHPMLGHPPFLPQRQNLSESTSMEHQEAMANPNQHLLDMVSTMVLVTHVMRQLDYMKLII